MKRGSCFNMIGKQRWEQFFKKNYWCINKFRPKYWERSFKVKQNIRWQHLSQMKNRLFWLGTNTSCWYKQRWLFLGPVLPPITRLNLILKHFFCYGLIIIGYFYKPSRKRFFISNAKNVTNQLFWNKLNIFIAPVQQMKTLDFQTGFYVGQAFVFVELQGKKLIYFGFRFLAHSLVSHQLISPLIKRFHFLLGANEPYYLIQKLVKFLSKVLKIFCS